MPTMSGVDLARQFLSASPDTRVVVMSGYSPTWSAESLRQIGVRDLLMKPITLTALSSSLRNAPTIARSRPGRRSRARAAEVRRALGCYARG
jgi:YesN/AraC family two-component response regulator